VVSALTCRTGRRAVTRPMLWSVANAKRGVMLKVFGEVHTTTRVDRSDGHRSFQ
jgi:hypothetical protein